MYYGVIEMIHRAPPPTPQIQRVHLNKAMDKKIDLAWSRLKLERPEVVNRTGVK